MTQTDTKKMGRKAQEQNLLNRLDRGIDDMEAKRELPITEAFEKISELRNIRRNARI